MNPSMLARRVIKILTNMDMGKASNAHFVRWSKVVSTNVDKTHRLLVKQIAVSGKNASVFSEREGLSDARNLPSDSCSTPCWPFGGIL